MLMLPWLFSNDYTKQPLLQIFTAQKTNNLFYPPNHTIPHINYINNPHQKQMNIINQPPPSSASLTTLQQIFDKVRTLCKECQLGILPVKVSCNDIYSYISSLLQEGDMLSVSVSVGTSPTSSVGVVGSSIGSYVNALDELRTKIFEFHELQEQYKKLEAVLQKNQTQIRKHIGMEQQFRLYIDTIKGQFEQSENQRMQLLENSKLMIRQLEAENQRLTEKVKEYEEGKFGGLSRCPDTEKKNMHLRNKQRLKSQHCSSLHINHNRNYTENNFISPTKQRIKPHDFRIELTQRMQNSKKKKVTQIKKKQNYTVMAYIGHKKRESKDKNQYKKALLAFSHKKKINFGSEIKGKQMSEKKVNKSAFSLQSIDYAQQQ